ncbi:MAG TPA: TonB family protein [Gemmataceae bacterium]|nr:TonB family protein [Gemmataceae bacterium]
MSVRFLGLLAVSALVHALLLTVVVAPDIAIEQHPPLILTVMHGKVSVEDSPASAAARLPQPTPELNVVAVEPIPAPTPLPPTTETKPAVKPVLEQLTVKPAEHEELPKLPRPVPIPEPQHVELMPPPRPLVDVPVQPAADGRRAATPARAESSSATAPQIANTPPPKPPTARISVPQRSSSPPNSPSTPRDQGVKTEARLMGSPRPVYPRQAQLRGWQGQAIVLVNVSAKGQVLQVKLHESSGYDLLDQSALRFTETLEFVPARRGKVAVATQVLLPVKYRLVDRN